MKAESEHSERQEENRELSPVPNESSREVPKPSVHWTIPHETHRIVEQIKDLSSSI